MYNYYNYGRQPYYVPMGYQQPIAQPQTQAVEMAFSDVRILNAEQIKGFIPPINSKVLLIDKDNGVAIVETTDNMGNMYKESYSFIKGVEGKEKPFSINEENFSNLATKKDIEAIVSQLEKLQKPTTNIIKNNEQK